MTSPVTLAVRLPATRVTPPVTPRGVTDDPIRVTRDPTRNPTRNPTRDPTTGPVADTPALHAAPAPPAALLALPVLLESV